MDYYIDLLEPPRDLNKALDLLGNAVGRLYQKHWDEDQKQYYENKPFDLNVQAFAQLWYNGDIKIFVARSCGDNNPVGFLAGIVFRPMAYNATVFSIQDWYFGGDKNLEKDLFEHASKAVRLLNCNEIWVSRAVSSGAPVLPSEWKYKLDFTMERYVKE